MEQAEAHAYGAKMVADPSADNTRGKPFVEVARDWLAIQRGMDLKVTTINQYESQLKNWIMPTHGRWGFCDYRITSVTGGDIQRLLGEMQKQGLSGSTRKQVFGLVGMIGDYALAEGLIRANPQDQVPRNRRPSNKRARSPQPLSSEEAHAIHDRIAEQRYDVHVDYALMVLIAFYQGMRFSEIAGIRRRDLNLKSKTLHVANPAKNGDARTMPMLGPMPGTLRNYVSELGLKPADLLFPALGGRSLPWLKVRRAKEMRAAGAVLREIAEELDVSIAMARTYSLATPDDRPRGTDPVTRGYYRKNLWDPAVEALGLPERQFRDLRNSCIRALLTGGIDGRRWPPDLVQQFIGHSDSRMTMDVYHQIYDTDVQRFAFSADT
ncbi:MAG: tyrosine-type recombinase/integrase [Euzebya sp.]